MLIKKPVFPTLRDAVRVFGSMALSPYGKNAGDGIEEIVVERQYELEEYRYKDGNEVHSVVALWGNGDYFFAYGGEQGEIVIVDGVHNNDNQQEKVSDEILNLLKRCMLVGYVPRALLQAVRDYGRGGPEGDFENIFGDCMDHVEDILESLEV